MSADCFCSTLVIVEDVQSHTVLAQALFQGIYVLPDAYNNALQSEDLDKCINLCRIFTELAESLLEVMVNTPTQGTIAKTPISTATKATNHDRRRPLTTLSTQSDPIEVSIMMRILITAMTIDSSMGFNDRNYEDIINDDKNDKRKEK